MDNKFVPDHLDFSLSPCTGLTRDSWIQAAKYMLEGIFRNIPCFEDPVIMPRAETEITYPHKNAPEQALRAERRAEIFEGLARSFFIAAPLIEIDPHLKICGYPVRKYYKTHILRICTKGDPLAVGDYEDLQELTGRQDPTRTFQQTVETCALVICLWVCKDNIWDTYSKEERDTIAAFLSSFAHAATVPQNWRLFNMLDLAFLNMEGYPIDRDIMRDHAQAILAYYAGDGWYRDGHSFDYYSCWAFQFYAPLWCQWYGYEHEPYLAKRFEENSNRLMETYADFFDRDGHTNMWGRSCIYRCAAVSAFEGNLFLRNSALLKNTGNHMRPGLARRIASGSLMQFLGREDFLTNGVPAMGFYGQFSPLVQGYSCAESVFWMGKIFLCLHLPADHPFWTEKEDSGSWEDLADREVKETTLNGPALCFSNHEANGSTILRTGKVVKNIGDLHGMWNYGKLCYHTKYPWEGGGFLSSQNLESMQYVLKDVRTGRAGRCNVTFWAGEKDGILYRRQYFDYRLDWECHWMQAVNLADFPVPYGILRADKLRLFCAPVEVTLGALGFPDNGTEIQYREEPSGRRGAASGSGKSDCCGGENFCGGAPFARAIILKGTDATGQKKQLAMTVWEGWDELSYVKSRGTNPDSEHSIVIYAKLARQKQYGYEPYFMISQVITREDHEDFTQEDLFPIEEILYTDEGGMGGYGPVRLKMKSGRTRTVDFDGIEGKLSL